MSRQPSGCRGRRFSRAAAFSAHLVEQAIRSLLHQWRDPDFWRDHGAAMDSRDCAGALQAALDGTSGPPARVREEQEAKAEQNMVELQNIDSLIARRPALEERTRYDAIAKAIRVASEADKWQQKAEAAEAERDQALQRELSKVETYRKGHRAGAEQAEASLAAAHEEIVFRNDRCDALRADRDRYRTLANIGTWHADCRPNRKQAADVISKMSVTEGKLAERITELNKELAALRETVETMKATVTSTRKALCAPCNHGVPMDCWNMHADGSICAAPSMWDLERAFVVTMAPFPGDGDTPGAPE